MFNLAHFTDYVPNTDEGMKVEVAQGKRNAVIGTGKVGPHNRRNGTIHAEFSDQPGLTNSPTPSWPDPLQTLLPGVYAWSVYTDASWRAKKPLHSLAVFGTQGTHEGCGALFLTADSPDWCSHIAAVRFEIPPTLQALGGTAQVVELQAIYAGLFLLHSLNLRGSIYSACLAVVKKITRRWTPDRAFQDAGTALVAAARALRSDTITVQ